MVAAVLCTAGSSGDLSDNYRTTSLQQDESLAYVKEQLGHASIQITVDVYGHLIPG